MSTEESIFYTASRATPAGREDLVQYANLKLASLGQPTHPAVTDVGLLELAGPLLRNFHQKDRLLGNRLCPADSRIARFLDRYLVSTAQSGATRLPAQTFTLDRPGLARVLSLPARGDSFSVRHVHSYRAAQGVLHNPSRDRRTTQGLFHIVEGGFPIPHDKAATPKEAFDRMLAASLMPPADDLILPFSSQQEQPARLFVSLLIRPLVCPATGADPDKTMEIRFFVPGSLVSNLDFVESIFGNAGDPYLPENDAALDVEHWTGHTGCVILAPHLAGIRKKDLGLPRFDAATERQRRDGMCWQDPDEPYNEGRPFKLTCRDASGVIVTILADNYFGYCKKEVKTQISFAANLFGLCEEEHAGGAIAFPSYLLGSEFYAGRTLRIAEPSFQDSMRLLSAHAEIRPEGYAVDRKYPDIVYVPGDAGFSVRDGFVRWRQDGGQQSLRLRPGEEYILPSGYRVRLEKQPSGTYWRLVGTRADSTLCHKPCTVSGGGKSEISKSISNAILRGPVYVGDFERDMDWVDRILKIDFTGIYVNPQTENRAERPLLSSERTLGSVIKLLTPSEAYTPEYNARLRAFPENIRQLVCVIKQHYRPEWGDNWRQHFSVDRINGAPGHELKLDDQKLVGTYLRVGFEPDGSWRIFKLRPDFNPAAKVQVEDDITASVVIPREALRHLDPECANASVKLVANCEAMLFQRPDDAIHRGFDKQAEADLSGPDVFLSNFEPLTIAQARAIADEVTEFDKYSEPMKALIRRAIAEAQPDFVVSSAHPRLVDGKPSKNPRYLQKRPDLVDERASYLAAVSTRLRRRVPAGESLRFPVDAVLPGRRGNPPDRKLGLPPLAVYGPIHYQELPELLMDFICSVTGKSPSTTGFGSEGALTKRPFNALPPVIDLNNALVSLAVTGYAGFSTAAGFAGPHYRVDHDITMLVPEIWCRMTPAERDPSFLIANRYLEKVEDFDYQGRMIPASRLGYRITPLFVDRFFARIFEFPGIVLSEAMLRPEQQDMGIFVEGIEAIVESQRQVALEYFEDGTVEAACPPVRAVLSLMAHGRYCGMTAENPKLRLMFTREAVLGSGWYAERLIAKQRRDIELWTRHLRSLADFEAYPEQGWEHRVNERLAYVRGQLERVSRSQYVQELQGTIGIDVDFGVSPIHPPDGSVEDQQLLGAGVR
jgi:hypothetical protein